MNDLLAVNLQASFLLQCKTDRSTDTLLTSKRKIHEATQLQLDVFISNIQLRVFANVSSPIATFCIKIYQHICSCKGSTVVPSMPQLPSPLGDTLTVQHWDHYSDLASFRSIHNDSLGGTRWCGAGFIISSNEIETRPLTHVLPHHNRAAASEGQISLPVAAAAFPRGKHSL